MMVELQGRQSRMLALLLLFALFVLLVACIAVPAMAMNRHYDNQIQGMLDQLQVYQRVARNRDRYERAYEQLQRKQDQDRRYLQSNTESLATAELQRSVKLVITKNKGEILSLQVIRSTEEEGFVRVTVRIRMKTNLEAMLKTFHALETSKPYLIVDDVSVRSRNMARRRIPSAKAIEEAVALLDIDFQVSGYMRGEKQ